MIKERDTSLGLAAMVWMATACSTDSCFVAGTLIATPRGPRPIESLAVGDSVWSYFAGKLVERHVEAVHRSVERVVCKVSLQGAVVRGVTPRHPFFDAARQCYTPLCDLGSNAQLLVFEGTKPSAQGVRSLEIEEASEPRFEVFNLTVSGEHNYIADSVLVHNKEPPIPTSSVTGSVASAATGSTTTASTTAASTSTSGATTGSVNSVASTGTTGTLDTATASAGGQAGSTGDAGGAAGNAGAGGEGGADGEP